MSDILKSMQDALGELDTTLENPDEDIQQEEEDTDKGVSFDLEKGEDALEEFFDVSDFLKGLVEHNDRNTGRLARATEASLSLVKAQSEVIKSLFDEVQTLKASVEKISAEPQPARAAVNKGQADDLLKGLVERDFDDGVSPVVPQEGSRVTLNGFRSALIAGIQKARSEASEDIVKSRLGDDIINLQAMGSFSNLSQVVSCLSNPGKDVAKGVVDKLSADEQAAE